MSVRGLVRTTCSWAVPPTGSVHRDGSVFLCIVTGSSMLWDFGSLHLKASRRQTGQLLRRWQAQQVRRCGVKELKLVSRMERSFVESFIWQLAWMKSKSCPCSPSRRLSCDRLTHSRALTKFTELSPRVMFQCIEAGREHQLGPSVDTRSCVSFRSLCCITRIST